MRISYWSSDVCSSDLRLRARAVEKLTAAYRALGSEAEYDAGRELETAIDEATASATQLGTALGIGPVTERSEEHTSELQSLMRISYAVFCLTKKNTKQTHTHR